MSVYHMWTLCPWRLEERVEPPETGIMETVNYCVDTGKEPRSSARTRAFNHGTIFGSYIFICIFKNIIIRNWRDCSKLTFSALPQDEVWFLTAITYNFGFKETGNTFCLAWVLAHKFYSLIQAHNTPKHKQKSIFEI